MKGQVEFFVIFGILIVVVVVFFYGYMSGMFSSPLPEAVAQQQESIKLSFDGFIRDSAHIVISSIAENGGYVDDSDYALGSVTFHDVETPYWQYFGETSYPDLAENIKTAMIEYINDNKDFFFAGLTGYEIDAEDVSSITMTMLDEEIKFDIYMPLSIIVDDQVYPFQQPLSVTVQTDIGQIYDFAKEFTYSQANDRLFEVFTISTMALSPMSPEPPGGVQEVPMFVSLTDCGQVVLRTWFDLEPYVMDAIEKTIANTYMPGKSPRNNIKMASAPEYEIPVTTSSAEHREDFESHIQALIEKYDLEDSLDVEDVIPSSTTTGTIGIDKYYSGLDVGFGLPDDFELTPANFQFSPNPITAFAKPIAYTSVCASDPIMVKYYLTYPLVVSVKDQATGAVFSFANTVYIYENKAVPWSVTGGYDPSELQEICSGASCPVEITVEDSDGKPIQGASISFFNCPVGKSDAEGLVDGLAPCGVGRLRVYANGYATRDSVYASSELEELSLQLTKIPFKNVHVYEVNVQKLNDSYMISKGDIGPINTLYNHDDEMAMLKFYYNVDDYYTLAYTTTSGTMSYVPANDYYVSGTLTGPGYMLYGAFLSDYTLGTEDGDLYIYMPYMIDFRDFNTENIADYAELAKDMYNLLSTCGLGPISSARLHDSFDGCTVNFGEL